VPKTILFTILAVLFAGVHLAAQGRIIDLTSSTPELADWKITSSRVGGSIGVWPLPQSHKPVTVRLSDCAIRGSDLYFSLEIVNARALELLVPVSTSSKRLDHPGPIAFTQLWIALGTAPKSPDQAKFLKDPNLPSIMLFGDKSIPNTTAALAPGERLMLHLKEHLPPHNPDPESLRVQIAGDDVTLSPDGGGYSQSETWIPALFATSEPGCRPAGAGAK
jgi:hypothetical protein